jgi:hypothetical protein
MLTNIYECKGNNASIMFHNPLCYSLQCYAQA